MTVLNTTRRDMRMANPTKMIRELYNSLPENMPKLDRYQQIANMLGNGISWRSVYRWLKGLSTPHYRHYIRMVETNFNLPMSEARNMLGDIH